MVGNELNYTILMLIRSSGKRHNPECGLMHTWTSDSGWEIKGEVAYVL
ncbi:uncharacterized protein L203_106295 [Cryptococcus depauperatus CBS 7841]|uniref:Uncharacterized protein n=1 Tax=Cryptococcus depauperatus CBS 7841 TaxID=1295531 RepID=A0AAJ8M4B7_9TREE